jgi:hypothetical protein
MAKKANENRVFRKDGVEYFGILPLTTEVEVVATKDGKTHKTKMSYDDALCMKKVAGWTYNIYQPNFCSIPDTK